MLNAQRVQTTRIALANGTELPFAATAINLSENHGRLGRVIFRKVEPQDFLVAIGVDEADEGIENHPEVLLARLGVMDGDRNDQSVDVRRHLVESHLDGFVVAVAVAGSVIAGVLDRAAG